MTLPDGYTVRGCATRDELERVVDLLDRAFDDTPREYFERHVLNDPTLEPDQTRILEYGGEVLSTVQIFPRMMNLGSGTALFGGIGNVATDPGHRKSGLAAFLMRDAIEWMNKRGYVLSMLSTGINAYYERFGFSTVVRSAHCVETIRGLRDASVRVFDEARDLGRVKALYDLFSRGLVGTLVRDDAYWTAQFDFCGEDRSSFLVLETGGGISAYLRAAVRKGKLLVLEFGADGRPAESFDRLLHDLAARNPLRPIEFFLSEGALQRLTPQVYTAVHDDTELMVCPLDHPAAHPACAELVRHNACSFWMSDFF